MGKKEQKKSRQMVLTLFTHIAAMLSSDLICSSVEPLALGPTLSPAAKATKKKKKNTPKMQVLACVKKAN